MMNTIARTCILAGLLAWAMPSEAQTTPSTIRVTGQAIVEAPPDEVEVDLGVVTRADSSQRASTDNARRADAVLAAIRRAFPAAEVRSVGYAVRPEYNQPTGNAEPRIVGYTATNMVRVTLADVGKAGELVDAASAAGANRVERVRYGLSKDDALRADAVRQAATAARNRAETMASALGVRIVRVLEASDDSAPPVRPFGDVAMLARAGGAPDTPLQAGPIEVTATVTLTVEVAAP